MLIWADQVLDALDYLHSQPRPIIHRDIKPGNIILTPQGKVKLVDFGLVKLYDPTNPRTATAMKGMGTPEYTPLEQYAGGAGHTDARSDIYALGATLYHLLTGVTPVNAPQRSLNPASLIAPRQLVPALSATAEAAVLKAMAVHPDQRFQSAREMRHVVARRAPSGWPQRPCAVSSTVASSRPVLRRGGRSSALVGALLLALLAFLAFRPGGWALTHTDDPLRVRTPTRRGWLNHDSNAGQYFCCNRDRISHGTAHSLADTYRHVYASRSTATEDFGSRPAGTSIYVVKAGDTLGKIAVRFGTTVAELLRLNGMANPDTLALGQTFDRPASTGASTTEPTSVPGTPRRYVVQKGDTSLSIARRYGLTVTQLLQVNGLTNPDRIYPGQTLVIP